MDMDTMTTVIPTALTINVGKWGKESDKVYEGMRMGRMDTNVRRMRRTGAFVFLSHIAKMELSLDDRSMGLLVWFTLILQTKVLDFDIQIMTFLDIYNRINLDNTTLDQSHARLHCSSSIPASSCPSPLHPTA